MGSTYNPLTPPGYTSGTLTISGAQIGKPQFLLALIQAQLEPNCPGASLIVTIFADKNNASGNTVKIGNASTLGGPLSDTNYGYELLAGGSSYRNSSGAGNAAPIADIQLFCSAAATIHVEIYS